MLLLGGRKSHGHLKLLCNLMANEGHRKVTVDHFMNYVSLGTVINMRRLKEFVIATDMGASLFVI